MDLADRIAKARKSRKLSQTQLATVLGVSRGACGQWEAGFSPPSSKRLADLARVLEVPYEWLATGRGESVMSGDQDNQVEKGHPPWLATVDEVMPGELQAFAAWLMRLPEKQRESVLKMLHHLQEMHSVCMDEGSG